MDICVIELESGVYRQSCCNVRQCTCSFCRKKFLGAHQAASYMIGRLIYIRNFLPDKIAEFIILIFGIDCQWQGRSQVGRSALAYPGYCGKARLVRREVIAVFYCYAARINNSFQLAVIISGVIQSTVIMHSAVFILKRGTRSIISVFFGKHLCVHPSACIISILRGRIRIIVAYGGVVFIAIYFVGSVRQVFFHQNKPVFVVFAFFNRSTI